MAKRVSTRMKTGDAEEYYSYATADYCHHSVSSPEDRTAC